MDVFEKYALSEVINVSGTMTAIGASSVKPEVVAAMADVLPRFVDMNELQARASQVISRVIGSEAGCVSASAASGICVSLAACIAGDDLHRAERLPLTDGHKNEVVVQRGHMVWYGASVGQLIRLVGGQPVEVGDATRAGAYQLAGAITDRTAAAVYVTSHHTVQYGLIDLETFCRVAHERGVPVVVDAASESEMSAFVEAGADLICVSGHKFLAGPTSGIIAGKADLVRACLVHQHAGIGRPMKVGKESIIGVMTALELWEARDPESIQTVEQQVLESFKQQLRDVDGIELRVEHDPTGNPIDRLKVSVDPGTVGLTAHEVASELARQRPAIIVRDHHAIDEGFIYLDPCNVDPGQAAYVGEAIRAVVSLEAGRKREIRARAGRHPNGADLQRAKLLSWNGVGSGPRD